MGINQASGASLIRAIVFLVALPLAFLTSPAFAQSATPQRTFDTPDQAVTALVDALRANNNAEIYAVLGPGSEKLLASGDPYAEAEGIRRFLAGFAEKHNLEPSGSGRMLLDVGNNDWQLPIPIVEAAGRWHFDSAAGAQELVDRRIGRNEIEAIRTLLACVDAEKAYFALTGRQGHAEYAGRLVSTPGEQNGLYWPAASDAKQSPLGPLVATAEAQGYPGELVSGKEMPYQGYYFRVLKAQGSDAPGGARDYVKNGHMTEGFALVAWPASYGSSGIMTFIVNQDGIVFQKDLGAETATIAAAMSQFDPDLSWAHVEIVNR